MQQIKKACLVLFLVTSLSACYTQHKVELAPVRVEPIHITIDVNIRVQKALDDFFGDLDKQAKDLKTEQPAKTN